MVSPFLLCYSFCSFFTAHAHVVCGAELTRGRRSEIPLMELTTTCKCSKSFQTSVTTSILRVKVSECRRGREFTLKQINRQKAVGVAGIKYVHAAVTLLH